MASPNSSISIFLSRLVIAGVGIDYRIFVLCCLAFAGRLLAIIASC